MKDSRKRHLEQCSTQSGGMCLQGFFAILAESDNGLGRRLLYLPLLRLQPCQGDSSSISFARSFKWTLGWTLQSRAVPSPQYKCASCLGFKLLNVEIADLHEQDSCNSPLLISHCHTMRCGVGNACPIMSD